ncbi:dihydropteroate synthase [Flocculibacter collagenilyticus]|uniref:dihydropteroate synthase n=1 Tax=Flocculibacter collagenilyticus TaxID=2744479 RepID=UPI0018F4332D|nr:dihydropteroate synthase [Flocculibacter collagenilyticus]
MKQIHFKNKQLNLSSPVVMGILNVTPDSFSDGGQHNTVELAVKHAKRMLEEGAEVIDIGGESTRPGAPAVSLEDELKRVIPVIEILKRECDCIISIDTSKPEVMKAAIDAGADMINDVCGLQLDGAKEMAAELAVPVCIMHMQGTPRTMQKAPQYEDVTRDIIRFFKERISACLKAGIKREMLLLDPGFGFGKSVSHNYQLLATLAKFHELELPLLIGLSRKSMIGAVIAPQSDRISGSIAGAVIAAMHGAHILRVHDVKQTKEALAVVTATLNGVKSD